MRPTLVLASASPARLRTLRSVGLDPQVQVSGVDEDAVVAREEASEPRQVALVLAREKARTVARERPGCLVLGCDSVLDLAGEAYGKPASRQEARRRWRQLSGGSAVLWTGHWFVDTRAPQSVEAGEVAATTIHFTEVSEAEVEAYLDTGEPFEVAGGLTTDGLGGAFVAGIEGDHHNVVGVSLPLVRRLLAGLGVAWTDVWPVPSTADVGHLTPGPAGAADCGN